MKKILLLLLFAVGTHGLYAQIEFAPKSAVWHYNVHNHNVLADGELYCTIQYDHDTTIKGKIWKVLKRSNFNQYKKAFSYSHYIIRQDSSVIRIWMDTFSNILVDFNMHIKHDSLVYHDTDISKTSVHFFYDSTGIINISGQKRKILYFLQNGYPINFIEGIGCVSFAFTPDELFNIRQHTTFMTAFRCYSDSVISYKNIYAPVCDTIIIYTGINNPEAEQEDKSWKIYPVPFSDYLEIQNISPLKNETLSIQIYTLTGQKVYEKQVLGNILSTSLHLNDLAKGLYILRIQSPLSQQNFKILKQ